MTRWPCPPILTGGVTGGPSCRREAPSIFMDSAQLYRELVESGDRLLRALANERKTSLFNHVRPGWTGAPGRCRASRGEVEKTAQVYAAALRTYRMAMLSELEPLVSAPSGMLDRVSKHRERARGVSTPFADRLAPALGRGKT